MKNVKTASKNLFLPRWTCKASNYQITCHSFSHAGFQVVASKPHALLGVPARDISKHSKASSDQYVRRNHYLL